MEHRKRFLLVRVGAPPLELKPNAPFVVGRSPDCELTVPSPRVSRRHTEIIWRRRGPWIRDLGSQNGTNVNGKRITGDHELRDNDEITIGPFLCSYRVVAGPRGAVGRVMMTPDSNALTQPMVGDAMAGNLEQMSMAEILQTLEFNGKSGTLEIFGSDGDGSLVMDNGSPVFGKAGRTTGTEAVLTMIGFQTGQFSFSPQVSENARNISGASVTSLLLEAGRRMDEKQG